jgi:hypothetical protein
VRQGHSEKLVPKRAYFIIAQLTKTAHPDSEDRFNKKEELVSFCEMRSQKLTNSLLY